MSNAKARQTDALWFLEIAGQKTGPWSIEKLQSLLDEGKISPNQRVSLKDDPGFGETANQWLTVKEALLQHQNETLPHSPLPHLPPRPSDVVHQESSTEPLAKRREDPVLDLFDALQSSKDRKASVRAPTLPQINTQNKVSSVLLSSKLWLVISIALSLGGFVWITQKLLEKSSEMATKMETNSRANDKTAAGTPDPEKAATTETKTSPQNNPSGTGHKPSIRSNANSPSLPSSNAGIGLAKPVLRPSTLLPSRTEADRERERRQREERERDAREKEREREREKEEREREREEREREREMSRDRHRENQNNAAQPNNGEAAPANQNPPLPASGRQTPENPPQADQPEGESQ
jgi:hypothetical protein